MKATVLIDNISNEVQLKGEWGLSIFIEYEDKRILLDTGGTERYLENAKNLGIDINEVDYAVLSHAHYDHAYGMEGFFRENKEAEFYLRDGSDENCYLKSWIFKKYIGIKKGTLDTYKDRIKFVAGDYELSKGAYLIPHKTANLSAIGKKNKMYTKKDGRWYPDDFSHEQSLVFETEKGLVILNSCCHAGADVIIKEIENTFKDKPIYAVIGGFHLFNASKDEVEVFADRLKQSKVQKIYTGHCTGENSYKILKDKFGDKIEKFESGLVIEL